MSLDSYNSQYPLEYYEVGTCYAFYKSMWMGNRREATKEEIASYSDALEKSFNSNKKLLMVGNSALNHDIYRSIGAVLSKDRLEYPEFAGVLEVLFKNDGGDYFVTKYGVAGKAIYTNDHEEIIPGTTIPSNSSTYITGKKPVSIKVSASGSSNLKAVGPTPVAEAGPTKVGEVGPTKVEEVGPTRVSEKD